MVDTNEINSHLDETRTFEPPADFAQQAGVSAELLQQWVQEGKDNPTGYWESAAREIVWKKEWDTVLEWNEPRAKWFTGGELNATDSCLDQHLTTFRKNKAALIWEGEPGDTRTITYQQLFDDVCRFAGALRAHGVEKGDRVAIYMPLVPEIAVACWHVRASEPHIPSSLGGFRPTHCEIGSMIRIVKLSSPPTEGFEKVAWSSSKRLWTLPSPIIAAPVSSMLSF